MEGAESYEDPLETFPREHADRGEKAAEVQVEDFDPVVVALGEPYVESESLPRAIPNPVENSKNNESDSIKECDRTNEMESLLKENAELSLVNCLQVEVQVTVSCKSLSSGGTEKDNSEVFSTNVTLQDLQNVKCSTTSSTNSDPTSRVPFKLKDIASEEIETLRKEGTEESEVTRSRGSVTATEFRSSREASISAGPSEGESPATVVVSSASLESLLESLLWTTPSPRREWIIAW